MSRRALVSFLLALSASVLPAEPPPTARPGSVVRWPGAELTDCSIGDRHWTPLDDACWFPIDLEAKGEIELVRRSSGGIASRKVRVGDYPYATEELTVEEKYVAPPKEALERIEREKARVAKLWALSTPRRFALPLAAPLEALPTAGRFGSRRVFNKEPRSPHSGADFSAKTGTVVFAPADGVVALAEEQYFAGNAVYLDHGDGLISMAFHLSRIDVANGDEVKRGQPIGKVGATGRVTGPHLHFAVRWHGARVDPELLLGRDQPIEIR